MLYDDDVINSLYIHTRTVTTDLNGTLFPLIVV